MLYSAYIETSAHAIIRVALTASLRRSCKKAEKIAKKRKALSWWVVNDSRPMEFYGYI